MRLPDDYEERSGMTPTVVTTIVAVTLFVSLILVVVLVMNGNQNRKASAKQDDSTQVAEDLNQDAPEVRDGITYPDTDELVTGSTLTPDDLDFWELYPLEEVSEDNGKKAEDEEQGEEVEENDPSTDGKHTLVQYADGKEEWVLISPYLPKHEYDFTKLVCQDNFMKYYEDGKQVSYLGVDISKYQDYVDFVKLKKAGINFVMLRVGARGYGSGQLVLDDYFSDNLKRATDAGLEVGVYFFSQAITAEEAIEEADMVLENIKDYTITYPVAFDMEKIANDTARIDNLTKAEKTSIAISFLDRVAAAGYKTMIYGNKEWLIKQIDMSKLTGYDVWLSQIGDIPDYPYKFTMWQYSTETSVDGIAGYANLNISFIDYSEK